MKKPSQIKMRKPIPFQFVLDELAPLGPLTRPMFGCTAIYVDEKIVFILREKSTDTHDPDNGVWVATTLEHHVSLKQDLPTLRSISVLGKGVTGWQMIPSHSPDFEELALRACQLVKKRDPRIGKIPKRKTSKLTTSRRKAR